MAATADKTLELIHLKYNWCLLRIAASGTAGAQAVPAEYGVDIAAGRGTFSGDRGESEDRLVRFLVGRRSK
jgi:hypothetical protein